MAVGRSDWDGRAKKILGGGAVFPALEGGNRQNLWAWGGVRGEYKRKTFLAAFGGLNFAF